MRRLAILPIALVAGLLTWASYRSPHYVSDFDQFWVMGRALLTGGDPYQAVARWWVFPSPYPLTAPLLTLPLALLPVEFGRVVFAMLAAGLFALACQRTAKPLWVAMLSPSFFQGVTMGQWSPFLTAGAVLPWLAVTWAAKPTVGLALFTGWPSRRALLLGTALVIVSLAVDPHWPLDLLDNAGSVIHRAPLSRPGGFLLLAAFLRWREPEARLLGALAFVPHSTAIFETLPLYLCCRSRWDAYALATLGYVAVFLAPLVMHADPTLQGRLDQRWPLMLGLQYLPALAMVLTRRGAAS